MNIMVTGGLGFIGSHLCDRLVRDGHEVVCYDNQSAGFIRNIAPLECFNNFHIAIGDTRDYDRLLSALQKYNIQFIFNQAASKKNVCLRDPREDCDVNAKGVLNLLMAAKEHGVHKIIHASTGSVYGELQISPQTEGHPVKPCSYYGVSKLAGERYVDMFDIDSVILRYFHVYGSKQNTNQDLGGVVAIWAHKLWRDEPIIIHGDGLQERSFTFVGDVVEANIRAMDGHYTLGGVYNCASGIKINLLDLLTMMEQKIGVSAKIIREKTLVGDIMKFDISNEKIKNAYGLKFKSLEDGLDETLGYYKPNN